MVVGCNIYADSGQDWFVLVYAISVCQHCERMYNWL